MDAIEISRNLVINFIGDIWNNNHFDKMDNYLHADFTDHSLPPGLSADKEGLRRWIADTGMSFEHRSIIEEQVTEANKSMIKLRLFLKHIGVWRTLQPTGIELSVVGYRYFKIREGKILEHWALFDGNAIENQLKDAAHGCKIQE